MTDTITWEQITDFEKFDYFACGLQPFDKTHNPIPCPVYCHKYHIIFNKIAELEFENGSLTKNLKQLEEWETLMAGNYSETITLERLSPIFRNMLDRVLNISCNQEEVNLSIENIKSLQACLYKLKKEYSALQRQLNSIIREDSDAKSWKFFQMPERQSEGMEQLLRLLDRAVFKKANLDEIRQTVSIAPEYKMPQKKHTEIDNFIKKLIIRYETDSQISIQQKGKTKINVDLTSLGFKEGGRGGEHKTWDNFITALQNSPNFYWHAPENKDKKQVSTVNKKLLAFLSKKFDVDFPDKFKLIERIKGEGKGIYGFGCKIEYEDTIGDIGPKDKKAFRELFDQTVEQWEKAFSDSEKQRLFEKVHQLASEGFEKQFLTKSEVTDTISRNNWIKATLKSFQTENSTTISLK